MSGTTTVAEEILLLTRETEESEIHKLLWQKINTGDEQGFLLIIEHLMSLGVECEQYLFYFLDVATVGWMNAVKFFISKGARCEYNDDYNTFTVAMSNGHVDIAKLLLEHSKETTLYKELMRNLTGKKRDEKFWNSWTALMRDCEFDASVTHSDDESDDECEHAGVTILMLALQRRSMSFSFIEYVCSSQVVNFQAEEGASRGFEVGDTALHIACRNTNWRMIPFLLARGAKPNIRNCHAALPVDILVQKLEVLKAVEASEGVLDDSEDDESEDDEREEGSCSRYQSDLRRHVGLLLYFQNADPVAQKGQQEIIQELQNSNAMLVNSVKALETSNAMLTNSMKALEKTNEMLVDSVKMLMKSVGSSEEQRFISMIPVVRYSELRIGSKIGEGTSAKVYVVSWKGKQYAFKQYRNVEEEEEEEQLSGKKEDKAKEYLKEAAMILSLCSPFIIQVHGHLHEPSGLLLEYMNKGCLYDLLMKPSKKIQFTMKQKGMIALDIAKGILVIHEKGVIHRDIKPENVFIHASEDGSEYFAKIGDFGTAKVVERTMLAATRNKFVGSFFYMAPELFGSLSSATTTSASVSSAAAADIYSFGMLLYCLLVGKQPYGTSFSFNMIDFCKSVLTGARPVIPASCPAEWSKLMQECWHPDPSKRPCAHELVKKIEVILL